MNVSETSFKPKRSRTTDHWLVPRLLPALILLLFGCVWFVVPANSAAELPIPAQSDWVDYGPILRSGDLGEWDYLLWGGFAGTAVKKGGTTYLYYQGASGYRTSYDETVLWRAIGVATSPDGINFKKYDHNPVLTWFPNHSGEEGAASGGATLAGDGEIVLYYGANTEQDETRVNSDGRLATSDDGLVFTDTGVVLDHTDDSLWGAGDELFPVIAVHDASRWFVYYIPNGTLQRGKLGVAWGANRDDLARSSAAQSGGSAIRAWGMGGSAQIGPGIYALFLNDVAQSRTEVRTVSLDAPDQLSAPVQVYRFDDARQATVLLDRETHTWFMYYRGEGEYGVKLAPAGRPDTTPPTAPANVRASPVSDRQVDLSWSPATDAETGIVLYKVFRDGAYLATTKGWSFSDTGLAERTTVRYQVSAVNYHGVEGPHSAESAATTPADATPPHVVSVSPGSHPRELVVVLNETVERASAEVPAHYTINRCTAVTGASLASDRKTVTLTTSQPVPGTYRIAIDRLCDQAKMPNPIAPHTSVDYTYTGVPGLAGAWLFDTGSGKTAFDTANYRNHGALIYTDKPGPAWTDGKSGRALWFDGLDDQVIIPGSASLEDTTDASYTFSAWVHPDSVPPNTSANNASYSILVRQYTGLYYDHSRRFKAQVRLADGSEVTVSSGVFEPGQWHHLAMAVDDVNKRVFLFVDGQEATQSHVPYTGTLADHKKAPYYVGTSEPLTELYELRFHGKIDQVWVYDRALSASQVQALFTWAPSDSSCPRIDLPVVLRPERPF